MFSIAIMMSHQSSDPVHVILVSTVCLHIAHILNIFFVYITVITAKYNSTRYFIQDIFMSLYIEQYSLPVYSTVQ